MMRARLGKTTLLAVLLMGAPDVGHAFAPYVNNIPNGTCVACHLAGGNPRNLFGQAVEVQMAQNNGAISWPGLFAADSDADTYTNGEELGDPCGVWTNGAAPITTGITDPGDAASLPAAHTTASCSPANASSSSSAAAAVSSSSAAAAGATGSSATTSGGSSSGSSSSSSGGGVVVAVPRSSSTTGDTGEETTGPFGCATSNARSSITLVALLMLLRALRRR